MMSFKGLFGRALQDFCQAGVLILGSLGNRMLGRQRKIKSEFSLVSGLVIS